MELSGVKPRSIACLLLFGLAASLPAAACINAFGTDKDGKRFDALHYTGPELEKMLTHPREESYFVRDPGHFEKRAKDKPTFENRTNLGVSWIYQGRYTLAIRHFLQLEKSFPGRPETAANLGTALELAGHDQIALKWIGIGIKRDRNEHSGTEWLHARILEAKIAYEDDAWDRARSIAGVLFGPELIPVVPKTFPVGNDGKPVQAFELDRAFRYQLNERMKFVRPKDWVVANLLVDWATLNLAGGPVENAKIQYKLALRYGLEPSQVIKQRLSRIDQIIATSKNKASIGYKCEICEPLPSD